MYLSSQHTALKRTGRVEGKDVMMMWQEEGVEMLRAVAVGTVPDLHSICFSGSVILHSELGKWCCFRIKLLLCRAHFLLTGSHVRILNNRSVRFPHLFYCRPEITAHSYSSQQLYFRSVFKNRMLLIHTND